MTDDVRAAYDAPFPEERAKAGARAMPTLVPTRPDDPATEANRAAWAALGEWRPAVPGRVQRLRPDHRRRWRRSCSSTSPARAASTTRPSPNAGHFLQEDAGAELGRDRRLQRPHPG